MFLFSLILIIGAITTFTDLKSRKIYNQHLAIGAVLGLIATAYTAVFRDEDILFHAMNGLVAFLIGFILHRSALWKGGDAKLFALYAFLMPPPIDNNILLPNVINLFFCSFIGGMVILSPIFIKDIFINRSIIVKELFLPAKFQSFLQGSLRVFFLSWILFPFYFFVKNINPFIILATSYIIFSWHYDKVRRYDIIGFFKRNFIELSVGILFGFLARLWLAPNSLSYPSLIRYITIIMLSITISTCIRTALNHLKEYRDRVPFAPLLFMGCILSYTPFLTWFMQIRQAFR
jgi:Flp pilus assembly protein protease CpaA